LQVDLTLLTLRRRGPTHIVLRLDLLG